VVCRACALRRVWVCDLDEGISGVQAGGNGVLKAEWGTRGRVGGGRRNGHFLDEIGLDVGKAIGLLAVGGTRRSAVTRRKRKRTHVDQQSLCAVRHLAAPRSVGLWDNEKDSCRYSVPATKCDIRYSGSCVTSCLAMTARPCTGLERFSLAHIVREG